MQGQQEGTSILACVSKDVFMSCVFINAHLCLHVRILVFMWCVHPPLSPCHIAFLCFQFPYYTLASNQMDLHEYKIRCLLLSHSLTHIDLQKWAQTQTSLKSFKCISQLPLRALFRICQGWKQTWVREMLFAAIIYLLLPSFVVNIKPCDNHFLRVWVTFIINAYLKTGARESGNIF